MSYIICRVEKRKRAGVSKAQDHNERIKQSLTNKDIDPERTKHNIVISRDERYLDYIDKRLNEIPPPKRKRTRNNVFMAEFLITASPEFFKDVPQNENFKKTYAMDFFKDAKKFIENKYGKENVIAASIHLDEATPHMHIDIVPIVDNKLNPKALFTPAKLQKLQTEIWKEVGEKYGLERGKPKDKEHRRKHLSVNAYKAREDARIAQELINDEKARIESQWDDILALDLTEDERRKVLEYGQQLIAERRAREFQEIVDEMVSDEVAPK